MNEQLIKNVKWLAETLDDFDKIIAKYSKEFNESTNLRVMLELSIVDHGVYTLNYMGLNTTIELKNILKEYKNNGNTLEQKVYMYIDNQMEKYINGMKNLV